jgi:hypothetical protein
MLDIKQITQAKEWYAVLLHMGKSYFDLYTIVVWAIIETHTGIKVVGMISYNGHLLVAEDMDNYHCYVEKGDIQIYRDGWVEAAKKHFSESKND